MFIKNSYTTFSILTKLLLIGPEILDNPNVYGNFFWTSGFLPTEMTRLWALVHCCSEISEKVGQMVNNQQV